MATDTTRDIVDSYLKLLIMQYLNKPNASGFINTIVSAGIIPQTTVQDITFSTAPTSGAFVLSYNGTNVASINWNDSTATIQGKIQAVSGLGSVTVTGSIASLSLIVTFTNVPAPAYTFIVQSSSLLASAVSVDIEVTETDQTIPLAVQDSFNLITGTAIAQGVQLDVIGQYVGVSRTGLGFQGTATITLDDSDFYSFIQMGIIKNQSGSSLATIQGYLNRFFPSEIYLTDHANMTMTYVISQAVGSQNLIQLFVTEGLLPKPMGVQIEIYYVPFANLFSFRTYELPNPIGSPFNDYASYQTDWPWLSYADLVPF